jgi:hypothetical protein
MQVLPATARLLGFMGSDRELDQHPTRRDMFGEGLEACPRRLVSSLMKYRAGHGEDQMTPLSVEYCRRVREHLNLRNRQVVEGPATLGNMLPEIETSTHAKPRITAQPLKGRAFWIAHEARIKGITALVRERWAL